IESEGPRIFQPVAVVAETDLATVMRQRADLAGGGKIAVEPHFQHVVRRTHEESFVSGGRAGSVRLTARDRRVGGGRARSWRLRPGLSSAAKVWRSFSRPSTARTLTYEPSVAPGSPASTLYKVLREMPARCATTALLS